MPYDSLSVIVDDRIATITVNRPDKLNALSAHVMGELGRAIDAARENPDVGGVILTGAGRAFVAGGDIAEVEKSDVIAAKRSGRIVQLNGAEVVSIDANVLQIRDGDASVRVIVTEGAEGVKAGDRVDLSGVTEQGNSGTQIRARNVRAKH